MKLSRNIIRTALFFMLIVSFTSCAVITVPAKVKHDNGNHYGWYKKSNTPSTIYILKSGKSKEYKKEYKKEEKGHSHKHKK